LKPYIDLIYYTSSPKIKTKDDIKIQIPIDCFKIDHISLIRGIPVKYRAGTPSIHDEMNLEEVRTYTFPLKVPQSINNNNNVVTNRVNNNNNNTRQVNNYNTNKVNNNNSSRIISSLNNEENMNKKENNNSKKLFGIF
jgi:hypothetical protein